MNKGSIVERLCSDLDRKEPRYKCATLLDFTLHSIPHGPFPIGGSSEPIASVFINGFRAQHCSKAATHTGELVGTSLVGN